MTENEGNETKARLLLLELGQHSEWPPPALLEALIACGEDAVQPLDELLSPELFQAAEEDESADLLSYYALGVLGSLGTLQALPILIRAFPLVDEDTQEWMDNWITPLGPDAIEPLLSIIVNDAVGEYHRATAANIAMGLAGDDPARRARVAEVLRTTVAADIARFGTLTEAQQMAVTMFSCDLAHMADAEALPMIEAAFANDQIDTSYYNETDLAEMYAEGGNRKRPPYTRKTWLERYREDYQKHQSTALLDKLETEDEMTEPVIVGKRLGRNDPCWCGSGKKYKKCHLAEDDKEGRL